MTHKISLTTRDGVPFEFTCEPGQDLLSAAQDAALVLPSQCRRGSCGACHATVVAGACDLAAHSPDALPAGEPGAILLCRATPRSDLCIVAPYDSAKVLSQPVSARVARIVTIDTIAPHTVHLALQVEPDDANGSAVTFEAGQFAELEIPGRNVRRAYSFANASNWEGRMEFLIRLQAQGAFSTWLRAQAAPGDALTVHGPQGGFGLIAGSLNARWFVAGGTGLAPVLAMLRQMAACQETNDARLFFGVSHERDLFMTDALHALQTQLPQLRVEWCVWHPGEDWRGFRGTPVDALTGALAQVQTQIQAQAQTDGLPEIYACGPPALVNGARAAAMTAQVPPEWFVSERF